MTCTFFGHRNCPDEIEQLLQTVLTDLIEHNHVTQFYVGNQGRFDAMVRKRLRKLSDLYPHIHFAVVLAYLPCESHSEDLEGYPTLYPAGLEHTPPGYAIYQRNLWMLNQSDCVVTYVRSVTGGAARFQTLAQRKRKLIFAL